MRSWDNGQPIHRGMRVEMQTGIFIAPNLAYTFTPSVAVDCREQAMIVNSEPCANLFRDDKQRFTIDRWYIGVAVKTKPASHAFKA